MFFKRPGARPKPQRAKVSRPKKRRFAGWHGKQKSRNITQKITRGILSVSLTGVLIVSCVAVIGVALMRGLSSQMYEKNLAPLRNLNQMSYEFNEVRVQLRDMALDIGNREDEVSSGSMDASSTVNIIDSYFDAINRDLQLYGKTVSSTRDKQNLKTIQTNVTMLQNNWKDMQSELTGSSQLQLRMMLQTTDSVDQALNQDIATAIQIKLAEAQQQNQNASMVCYAVFGAVLAALIFSIWFARLRGRRVARRITVPIHQTVELAEHLAEGDFDIQADIHTGDEMQTLSESFQKIVDALQRLQGDVQLLIRSAEEGRLDVRADPGPHKGKFREIVEGVNRTLDTMKTPLDASAIFLAKLAAGDQLEPLENTYQGYYGALVNNLNKVHHSLAILLEETGRLVTAGRSGVLDVRGDETRLNGSYREIIHGFNETIDAFMKPTQEAMAVLDRMAVNDYTTEMSGDYPGAFRELADAIRTVRASLLQIQQNMENISRGDVSHVDELRQKGRLSENDQIYPALLHCSETIGTLVHETTRLSEAANQGQLDVRGDENQFQGSFRSIIAGMNRTMEAVAAPLAETARVLQEVASNNLAVEVQGEYSGQYNQIKQSLGTTLQAFNDVIGQINMATSQVEIGSRQLSEASQSLSQGASEQASSIEQLTVSISQVASQTRKNADDATQASTIADQTLQSVARGNEKMQQMLASMKEIDQSSASISKIIKVIDDIAFQTNILALNAAVEAARAGQYGRGFAVVADEVRTLAARSAKAAKETTDLIESSARKTAAGASSATETAQMMAEMSRSIQQCTSLVENIAKASNEQANSITQIDQGLSQISSVVQTNSATAEESAASSEELSSQAATLKQVVDSFTLRSRQA